MGDLMCVRHTKESNGIIIFILTTDGKLQESNKGSISLRTSHSQIIFTPLLSSFDWYKSCQASGYKEIIFFTLKVFYCAATPLLAVTHHKDKTKRSLFEAFL